MSVFNLKTCEHDIRGEFWNGPFETRYVSGAPRADSNFPDTAWKLGLVESDEASKPFVGNEFCLVEINHSLEHLSIMLTFADWIVWFATFVAWKIAGSIVLLYVFAAMMIKVMFKYSAPTDVLMFDPADSPLPNEIRHRVDVQVQKLGQLGFRPIGYFALPKLVMNAKSISIMLINEKEGDSSMINALWGEAETVALKTLHVEFVRRFRTGGCLQTNNCKLVGCFRSPSDDHTFQFGNLQEPQQLYKRHRTIANYLDYGKPIISVLELFDGDIEAYIQERVIREPAAYQAKLGLMRPIPEGFGLTWKGAYVFTWAEAFPVKQLTRYFRGRKSERIYELASSKSFPSNDK